MKKAEEYIKEWSFSDVIPTRELAAIIKQVQIDTIDETVKSCAKNAKAKYGYELDKNGVHGNWTFYVDNQSIISVADELKKIVA